MCGIAFDGPFDGVRPSRASVECLAESLRAEKLAADALSKARDGVRSCLQQARESGRVTYSAIAAALVPGGRGQTLPQVIAARRRAAQALTCRSFEARKRGRVK